MIGVAPRLTRTPYLDCCLLQVMHNSATKEPRYISDGYELEGFALPVGFAVATVWWSFSSVFSSARIHDGFPVCMLEVA